MCFVKYFSILMQMIHFMSFEARFAAEVVGCKQV